MMNGVNQATFMFLPIFGKHPDEYPRFRDFFPGKVIRNNDKLDSYWIPVMVSDWDAMFFSLYLRIGGNNRSDYQKEIDELRSLSYYVEDYDDTFDSTFAFFIFRLLEKWESDVNLIYTDDDWAKKVSKKYKNILYKVYPKLSEQWDKLFNS